MSNHLLRSLRRQHILLSYFKTLSVGLVWGSNPRPPAQQTGTLPTELTRVLWFHLSVFCLVSLLIEKIYQTLKTVSGHISKHFEVRHKYYATRLISNCRLSIWKWGQQIFCVQTITYKTTEQQHTHLQNQTFFLVFVFPLVWWQLHLYLV